MPTKKEEGSITYLKDGRIRLRITNGTKTIIDKKTGLPKKIKNQRDFIGYSEKEVRSKYKKWKRDQRTGRVADYGERPIMDCIFEWIINVKSLKLKESSYSRLYQITETYVNPRFNTYRVNEITPDLIQFKLINDLKNKGLSHSTIKKATNVFTGFFRWAVGTQKVDYNPCQTLVLPSDKLIKEEKGETDEVKYYSKEEINKLKVAADAKNKHCFEINDYRYPRAYAYLFICYTGLRIGEMLALKWSDYDEEKKTISINKDVVEYKDSKTKKIVTKLQSTPKTSASRRILTLNDTAIEALKIIKDRSFNPNNEFVVANRNREGKKDYVAPSNFRNAFRRFCEFADVEYKGVHALRHTFASLMFAQDVDIKYISTWLGHSSVQITYDTYVHIMEEVGYEEKAIIPAIQI